jgi:hypothetical protein
MRNDMAHRCRIHIIITSSFGHINPLLPGYLGKDRRTLNSYERMLQAARRLSCSCAKSPDRASGSITYSTTLGYLELVCDIPSDPPLLLGERSFVVTRIFGEFQTIWKNVLTSDKVRRKIITHDTHGRVKLQTYFETVGLPI